MLNNHRPQLRIENQRKQLKPSHSWGPGGQYVFVSAAGWSTSLQLRIFCLNCNELRSYMFMVHEATMNHRVRYQRYIHHKWLQDVASNDSILVYVMVDACQYHSQITRSCFLCGWRSKSQRQDADCRASKGCHRIPQQRCIAVAAKQRPGIPGGTWTTGTLDDVQLTHHRVILSILPSTPSKPVKLAKVPVEQWQLLASCPVTTRINLGTPPAMHKSIESSLSWVHPGQYSL